MKKICMTPSVIKRATFRLVAQCLKHMCTACPTHKLLPLANVTKIIDLSQTPRQKFILVYKSQQDAHFTEFILSDNCSTCFWRHYHPSSGAQKTVTTASGNRYTVLLSAAIVEELELMFQLFHDSTRQQYGVTVTRCCSYSCLCS
jgi:hypothetical protein